MNIKNKVSKIILYASLLTFASFVIYILYINQEVLYTAHERSEFLIGTPFFCTLMSKPFGLIQYAGAWFTQFFYQPVAGAGILMAMWTLIFFIGVKAFRLRGSASALMLLPIAFLLTSLVDLGYWIYTFTIRGYWFSQTVGYLLTLTLLWIARCTPRRWHLAWYIVGFCLYPVLGWFALLFIVCLMIADKMTWHEIIGGILVFSAAIVWHAALYPHIKLEDTTMAGLPHFVTPSDVSEHLSFPFYMLGAASLLIVVCAKHLNNRFVPAICTVLGIVFTWTLMYKNDNYINEMRMVRYAQEDNWKEVLHIASEIKYPTTSMVMLKNVALMNEGGLLDRSFKMGNIASSLYNPDSVHVSFLQITAPIVYYNYGMINEGFHLSFECAVQSGFSPFHLKALTRCALANGEKKLAERYITMLHKNPFYSQWQPTPVTNLIQELHNAYSDEINGVENSDSYIVNSIHQWYGSEGKSTSEQALFYSMMRRDPNSFWPSLRKFIKLHEGEEFPEHAQEAYILYMDKAPEAKRMMIPVSETTYDRYKQFWNELGNHIRNGISKAQTKEDMRPKYGDTYWYYYIFGRKYM